MGFVYIESDTSVTLIEVCVGVTCVGVSVASVVIGAAVIGKPGNIERWDVEDVVTETECIVSSIVLCPAAVDVSGRSIFAAPVDISGKATELSVSNVFVTVADEWNEVVDKEPSDDLLSAEDVGTVDLIVSSSVSVTECVIG